MSDKPIGNFREIIIFEVLTAIISSHAFLTTANTPLETQVLFYAILLVMNWIGLILIHSYYKERGQLVDYNENLKQESFIYILGGIMGVFIFASLFSNKWTSTVIHVPVFSARALTTDIGAFAASVLYNIALIANSEETTKLVAHNAVYMYLRSKYPETTHQTSIKVFSVATPIGFWAILHAYYAFVGPLMWQLVFAAFVSGLIIFAIMWKTKSLLAAIIVHGFYNIIVLTAVGLGWLVLTVCPLSLLAMSAVNIILLCLARRKRTVKSFNGVS